MKPNYYTIHKNKKPKKLNIIYEPYYSGNLINNALKSAINNGLPIDTDLSKYNEVHNLSYLRKGNTAKQRMLHKFRTTGRYVK